ncbi:methyltransferase type 11 [Mycena albidolilacea]|uniref:Methyltransferase type 11 n=1 Tax=Mycena albidolilacea TaxID=1033008 RepID=A0AAD7F3M1_9AGAR|nr:methyltransferase type 11 [Mycena albidolilacea]
MASEYDSIGDLYTQTKTIPLTRYLETPTFHAAIQPYLTGHARVLDLACGTGFYSRLLLSWGASSVLGIDISSGMIDAARAHPDTTAMPDRLVFRVGDARMPDALTEPHAPFDVVTGAWLLPYAASSTEMTAMWETVARNLRPGGVFVGITQEPVAAGGFTAHVARQRALRAQNPGLLGIDFEYDAEPLASGEGYRYTVTPQVDEAFSFHAYHLPSDVYEAAAKKAGMTGEIEWRVMEVTEEARTAMGEGYWDRYAEEFMPKHAVIVVHK